MTDDYMQNLEGLWGESRRGKNFLVLTNSQKATLYLMGRKPNVSTEAASPSFLPHTVFLKEPLAGNKKHQPEELLDMLWRDSEALLCVA